MPSQTLSLDLNRLGPCLRGSSKLKLSRIEESGTAGGLTSTFSDENEEALKKEKPKSGLSAAEVVVSSWSYGADPNYPHCPKPSGHACQRDMPKSGGGREGSVLK